MIETLSRSVRLLFGASVLLVACAPAAPLPAAPAVPGVSTPQALADVQRFVLAEQRIAANMDPQLSLIGTPRRYDMFETLTIQSAAGERIDPLLAADWRAINPTTWRFTLREGSRFHDGTPLTSADVAFTWQRAQNPALRSPIPGTVSTVATITAIDPKTVEVVTKSPDPILLKRMAQLAIVPKAYIERVGDEEFERKPVGSGPFRFKEYRPNDRVIVSGWPEHPFRKPTLTEVEVRAIPDGGARLAGLRTGEIQMTFQLSLEAAETIRRDGFETSISAPTVVGALLDTWGTDGTNAGPIADKRVRQAINYAIDRDALAKTIYRGLTKPAGHIIQPGTFGYNPDVKQYTYDLARAKQLMAQAGYPNGFRVGMDFWPNAPEVEPTALYVQSQLKEIGIELTMAPVEVATFLNRLYKREAITPMFLGSLGREPLMDADSQLTWFWSENRTFGKRFNSPEFDRLYVASLQEMDPAKRETLLKQAAVVLQDDPPFLGLVDGVRLAAYSKKLDGAEVRYDFLPLFDRVRILK